MLKVKIRGQIFQKGKGKWAFVHSNDCNSKDYNKSECKKESHCKLFVIKIDEGVVRVKKLSNNTKLPIRGTTSVARFDLSVMQVAMVPAHDEMLMKIGMSMAIPPDRYGRIVPRSGLALKKFIDVGAGVIDSDYRGEIGVVLFNFGEEDFKMSMDNKIVQLIFEKTKTFTLDEVDDVDQTWRGEKGYGSTRMRSESETKTNNQFEMQTAQEADDQNSVQQQSEINTKQTQKYIKQLIKEPILHMNKKSRR